VRAHVFCQQGDHRSSSSSSSKRNGGDPCCAYGLGGGRPDEGILVADSYDRAPIDGLERRTLRREDLGTEA